MSARYQPLSQVASDSDPALSATSVDTRAPLSDESFNGSKSSQKLSLNTPRDSFRIRLSIASLVALVLLASLKLHPWLDDSEPSSTASSSSLFESSAPLAHCPAPVPPAADPPAPVNPWSPLNVSEIAAVHQWISLPDRGLNLTDFHRNATTQDNFIYLVELYPPTKAETVSYIEDPEKFAPPQRLARVTVHHGGQEIPVVKDYLVGPLPVSRETKVRELTEIYRREIPFHARGMADIAEFGEFVLGISDQLNSAMQVRQFPFTSKSSLRASLTQELFGASVFGANRTLAVGTSAPFSFDGSFRRIWITWRHNVAGPFLHPVDFFQYVDVSGTDRTKWKVLKVCLLTLRHLFGMLMSG